MCLWCASVTYIVRRNCWCVGQFYFFVGKISSARLRSKSRVLRRQRWRIEGRSTTNVLPLPRNVRRIVLSAKWRWLLMAKVGLRWCGFRCVPVNNGVKIEALTEMKFEVVWYISTRLYSVRSLKTQIFSCISSSTKITHLQFVFYLTNAYYSKKPKRKSVYRYGTNPQNVIHNDKTLIIESG